MSEWLLRQLGVMVLALFAFGVYSLLEAVSPLSFNKGNDELFGAVVGVLNTCFR